MSLEGIDLVFLALYVFHRSGFPFSRISSRDPFLHYINLSISKGGVSSPTFKKILYYATESYLHLIIKINVTMGLREQR